MVLNKPRAWLCLAASACALAPPGSAALGQVADEDRVPLIADRLPPRMLEQVAAYTREKSGGRGFITAKNLAWSEPYVTIAMVVSDDPAVAAYYPLIETIAKEWIPPGSRFRLSFRNNDNSFRTWSRTDRLPRGTIRIAFDDSGSRSLIGKQAQGRDVRPGEETMNLDLGPITPGSVPRLSASDRLTVLHEFGHALGLAHEHYHNQCQADLKFNPDPGYVETIVPGTENAPEYVPDSQGRSPGILKAMAGSPNFWGTRDIRFNYEWAAYSREAGLQMRNVLRGGSGQSAAGDAGFVQSAMIDRSSVMLYPLPAFLLKSGRQSNCRFTPQGSGVQLSAMDRQAFAALYQPVPTGS